MTTHTLTPEQQNLALELIEKHASGWKGAPGKRHFLLNSGDVVKIAADLIAAVTQEKDAEIKGLNVRIAELEEEVAIDDKLLEQRRSVMDAIPPCPDHGSGCEPHAVEWVESADKRAAEFDATAKEKDAEIGGLNRKNLELSRVYAERGFQIERLEKRIGELDAENLKLHSSLAGAVLHASQGWARYEALNKYALQLESHVAAREKR